MRNKFLLVAMAGMLLSACAQVPREAVELSATVGRDIAVTHKAHIQMAKLMFSKMKQDVNRFVDNVYAPYQIREAMKRQMDLAKSLDQRERNKSLMLALNAAFKEDASDKLQQAVLKGMGLFVSKIRYDVEEMREELLAPLNKQEKTVLGSINRAYLRMHYANSIVTGHLASVAKVHDTQQALLSEVGIERDLRKEIGEGLSKVSNNITKWVNQVEKAQGKFDKAEENASRLKEIIGDLGIALKPKKEEG